MIDQCGLKRSRLKEKLLSERDFHITFETAQSIVMANKENVS